ncbi:MAG TPA: hypothetical protein VFY43_03700, partial [Candidatus Limnocylindria bacterium]|nr:hypothetical protein [Candidatus Limnocylindria bacterium]
IGAVVAGLYRASSAEAFTRLECVSETECANSLFVANANGEHMIYPPADAEAATIEGAAWDPRGSQLAFVAGRVPAAVTASTPQDQALFVVNRDGGGLRRLHLMDEGQGPCGLSWAPDAGSIAVCVLTARADADGIRPATLINVDTATAATTTLAEGVFAGPPQWSPDGSRVLFQSVDRPVQGGPTSSSAWIVGADGAGRQMVASLPDPGSWGESPVAWAPDSQAIAFEGRSAQGEATIEIVGLDGTRTSVVPRRDTTLSYQRYPVDIEALAWSATGEIAYAARGNGFFEIAITSLAGESRTVTAIDDVGAAFVAQGMRWSSDGRVLRWLAHDPAVLGYCIVTFALDEESIADRCFVNSDSVASGF